nr:hypothetical protein [Mesorhizobium sp. Root157]
MRQASAGAVCLLVAALAGCTTSPADYAATLSKQDPKWQSPQCEQIRLAATEYESVEKQTMSVGSGLLLGPYGLGIALAGKEHREKQRKLFVRDIHMRCSSLPLPRKLQITPSSMRPGN